MKQLLLILTFFLFTLTSFSQDKKDLAISFSTGLQNSTEYENTKAKAFYRFGFDYHLTKRQLLSVNYFAGKHRYFDDILSNHPLGSIRDDGTNATAGYQTFSVMYKYKIVDNAILSVVPGVGAGILTHLREYPYAEVNRGYPKESSWTDLVFPVNLDINFKIGKQFQAGLTGGLLVHPDYPILAYHAGPKLSYIIR